MKIDEQKLINDLNEHQGLEYKINKLGKYTRNGNQYTYIRFFINKERDAFCKNFENKNISTKAKSLTWLDVYDRKIILSIRNIGKNLDENTVLNKIQDILGINQRSEFNKKISLKLKAHVTCSKDKLWNIWGFIIENQIINVELLHIKNRAIVNQSNVIAIIANILTSVDERAFTKYLEITKARYWYRVNKRNNTNKYKIIVLFNDDRDQRETVN